MDTASLRRAAAALLSFAVTLAAVLLVSLRGGGSYDLVVRNEAAIVVWVFLGAGIAIGVLPVGRWTRSAKLMTAALAGLAAWTGLAFLWTDSTERTMVELSRVVFFVGVVVLGLSVVNRRNRTAVLGGLFAGAATVIALAFAFRLYPSTIAPDYLSEMVGTPRRLRYPFGYWNAVGCLGAMVLCAGLCASVGQRRPAARGLCLAAALVAIPTTYVAYSRGAIIAAGVGILVTLAVSKSRVVVFIHGLALAAGGAVTIASIRSHEAIAEATGTSGRGSVLLVVVVAAAVVAMVGIATGRLGLNRRLHVPRTAARLLFAVIGVVLILGAVVVGPRIANEAWDSFSQQMHLRKGEPVETRLTTLSGNRKTVWESALDAFSDQPLHGIGPGTFEFWWDRDPRYAEYLRDAHSLYLESLAELGVVGILLVLSFVGTALVGGIVAARGRMPSLTEASAANAAVAALAVWATASFYDWIWESTAVTALALAGIAVAMPRTARQRTSDLPLPIRILAPVACLIALLIQLPPMASTSQVRGSEQAAAGGDLQLALSRANDAVASEPWASTPYLQRALVEELGGALNSAALDARRAAARQPSDYRPWLILSRIEARRGRPRAALSAYGRAVEAKPSIANARRR